MEAGGDEPGEVRDVRDQQRADLVRDVPELVASTLRGYAESPHMITFGRSSFAPATTSS